MIKVYGIKNCDTVKKAVKQLHEQQTPFVFVDLKVTQLSAEQLCDWLQKEPVKLINKRSTTYRMIKSQWLAAEAEDNTSAQIELIQNNQTIIKRPVLEKTDGSIIVGFDLESYKQLP